MRNLFVEVYNTLNGKSAYLLFKSEDYARVQSN